MTQTITKLFNGQPVNVIAVAGGWSTIDVAGKPQKVRNSQLFDLPANAVAPLKKRAQPTDAHAAPGRKVEAPVTPHHRFAEKQAAAEAAKPADAADASTRSIVKSGYKQRYERTDVKTASGSKVIDCGDKVAQLFRNKSLEECYKVVAEDMTVWIHPKVGHSGMPEANTIEMELKALYQHLNPGQQRMNLGNLIRPWHKLDAAEQKQLLAERAAKRARAAERATKA